MAISRSIGLATVAATSLGTLGHAQTNPKEIRLYGPNEQDAIQTAKSAANVSDVIRAHGAPYAVYPLGNNQTVYRWGAAEKIKTPKGEKLVHKEFLVFADSVGKVNDSSYKIKGELLVPSKASVFMPSAPF